MNFIPNVKTLTKFKLEFVYPLIHVSPPKVFLSLKKVFLPLERDVPLF